MNEEWRPIKGYEGRYEISSCGAVRSLPRTSKYTDGRIGRIKGGPIKGCLGSNGYLSVTLNSTDKHHIHRLVAEAFLPPKKSQYKETVNHIDGNKLNNHYTNLEWSSYSKNNKHARETGLNNQNNENCNLTKYSNQLITALKNVHKKYKPTYYELGQLFDMSAYHVGEIIRGESRSK